MSVDCLHCLDDTEIDSIEVQIGYFFKNRSLVDTAFTDSATARMINRERRPGRYINDNESLAYIGRTAINCLNAILALKSEDDGNIISGIDEGIHIPDRFLLPLIGAVAIDCCWDTETMMGVARRLFVPVWRPGNAAVAKATE